MDIYDGSVRLGFSDTGHRYAVSKKVGELWTPPEPVVGTTTVTSVISKPALMLWPLREAISHLEQYKGHKIDKSLLDAAYGAHKAKSQKGKDAGTVGHALVEALLLDKEYEVPEEQKDEAESVRKAFELWREDFVPEVLHTEQMFYSLTHQFAGTCDLVAKIGGKLTIVDYKTTNPSYYNPDGIYAENFAQLGAYALGIEEMLGLEIEEAEIVNLPKNGKEYKVKSLSDLGMSLTDAKLYFLYCLGLYRLNKDFAWKLSS